MLPRTLEPEVMDTVGEAVDYDSMDHTEVNRCFADEFLAAVAKAMSNQEAAMAGSREPASTTHNPIRLRVLDVGTGTARIPIDICRRAADAHVTGADLSAHMLQLGQRNVIQS